MNRISLRRACALLGAGFLMSVPNVAAASGFYVREHSTSALATAHAGAAAQTSDPSHMFFNPATIIENTEMSVAIIDARVFFPSVKIGVQNATAPIPLGGGNITAAGDSGSMADAALAPAIFASFPVSDRIVIGVGISAPFAVVIDANPAWAGRFQLIETDMRTANVNPVVAFKVSDTFALALGIQGQYFEGTFRKTEVFSFGGPPFEAIGFLEGTDIAFGVTAGALFQPSDTTKIGIGYRSQITHTLEGTAGLELAGVPVDGATFDITTPDVVTVSVTHQITEKLTGLATFEWSNWSEFTGFNIAFASGRPNELRPQVWDDTYFGALGLIYQASDNTSISGGVSFGTAVTSGGGNTLSPDGDRTTIAAGIQHQVNDRVTIKGTAAHTFFEDAPINIANASGTLAATFSSSLTIVGISADVSW